MPRLNPCGELMVWYSSKGLVDDLKLFILQLRQNKKKKHKWNKWKVELIGNKTHPFFKSVLSWFLQLQPDLVWANHCLIVANFSKLKIQCCVTFITESV